MLYRKIEDKIKEYFESDGKKILLIDGARQVGKTFIVRKVGRELFKNFIEINMIEDSLKERLFADVRTVEDFYFRLSMKHGDMMDKRTNTLIFIDEIQAYPHLFTLLKFLRDDNRYTYIASGSMLGVALSETSSIPMGTIEKLRMFPLDFEEFLIANSFGYNAIDVLRESYKKGESLSEHIHERIFDLFKKYLICGGMPEVVQCYIDSKNVMQIRKIQREIHEYYGMDASKYDKERKLMIRRIYDMLPSNLENKKKRVILNKIENKKQSRYENYENEFEYLISSGIAINVNAVSNPIFPLNQSSVKNLVKLYLNDVGILSALLYGNNSQAIINTEKSINLGAVYENVVASELIAHGKKLYYYDNRSKGEVDFLIDDFESLSMLPIEVKSGKDYTRHSALNNFVKNPDYNTKQAIVLSNEREIKRNGKIIYMPIYYAMFL